MSQVQTDTSNYVLEPENCHYDYYCANAQLEVKSVIIITKLATLYIPCSQKVDDTTRHCLSAWWSAFCLTG